MVRYTLPRALLRVDEATSRTLHVAAMALSTAAAAGAVEAKWGGVFGDELTSVVRSLKINADANALELAYKEDSPRLLALAVQHWEVPFAIAFRCLVEPFEAALERSQAPCWVVGGGTLCVLSSAMHNRRREIALGVQVCSSQIHTGKKAIRRD